MCARLGVRQAYSQANRHQTNGRAEVAGQGLIKLLKKLRADGITNWVEALPRALWHIHGLPGESGLSPFQIVFGRDRNEAGVPYPPLRESENARQFFDRMNQLDHTIADTLNRQHLQTQRRLNASRQRPRKYHPNDIVWVLRTKASLTDKLDSKWIGPARVLERLGEDSYNVLLKPNMTFEVHAAHLKPFVTDQPPSTILEEDLYHFLPTHKVLDTTPGEWNVEAIIRHRKGKDGKPEFLTRWEGHEPHEDSWEPVATFFPRYCFEIVQYCRSKGVKVDLASLLSPVPTGGRRERPEHLGREEDEINISLPPPPIICYSLLL